MSAKFEFPVQLSRVQRPNRKADVLVPVIPQVRRALVLAYTVEALIRDGKVPDYATAARWLGVSKGRVGHVACLPLLAPAIQEVILAAPPERLADIAERDLRRISLVPNWAEQTAIWAKLLDPPPQE